MRTRGRCGAVLLAIGVLVLGLAGVGGAERPARISSAKGPPGITSAPGYALTVNPHSAGRIVPPSFLGLSIEYWGLEDYTGPDPGDPNPVLAQLIRNLAPGHQPVLRVGGISTDRTWWPLAGAKRPRGVDYALSPRRIAVIKALAGSAGLRLILGVNLEADSRKLASAEARGLLTGIGRGHVEALEPGNEPELYTWAWFIKKDGQHVLGRPPGYDFGSYVRDYGSMAAALPHIALAGPASGSDKWLGSLSQLLDGQPRIRVVTVHRYPSLACFVQPKSPVYPRIGQLLSLESSVGLAAPLSPFIAVAHARHLPLRVDEMNTIACGTAPGISHTFVMGLWAIDALFADLSVGVDGVNIHTYPGAPYELFRFARVHGRWQGLVEPEYYGLLMFAQAAPAGSRLLTVAGTGDAIRAWATRARDGTIRVELINANTAQAHSVEVTVPGRVTTATLERLRAPGPAATSGVTLGGQSFGQRTASGVLPGPPATPAVAAHSGAYEVQMPPASAALLTAR